MVRKRRMGEEPNLGEGRRTIDGQRHIPTYQRRERERERERTK